jgi:SOS response regulatory protein OraA/RecX
MEMEAEVKSFTHAAFVEIANEQPRKYAGAPGREASAALLAIRIINTRDHIRNGLAFAVNQKEPDAEIARWARLLVHMSSVIEWFNALLANPDDKFASAPLRD